MKSRTIIKYKNMRILVLILMVTPFLSGFAQPDFGQSLIKEMSWGTDYKIKLKLKNDSVQVYNVKELHHTEADKNNMPKGFTFYPVNLDKNFIQRIQEKEITTKLDTAPHDSLRAQDLVDSKETTLWSALHGHIEGGWIHFVNTLLYSLENGYINLKSPLMKRPDSDWEPDPVTESYKRTRKWDYYVPINQRYAIKEYKTRKKNGKLGDLQYIPQRFIQTFLNTNNREYKKLRNNDKKKKLAQIDLIKLLVGSRYLSTIQINYIKNMVLKAVTQYSKNRLPSVIIFENFNAAVAMTLDQKGYHIKKIKFKDVHKVSEHQLDIRRKAINDIVNNINDMNKEMFQKELKNYYNN